MGYCTSLCRVGGAQCRPRLVSSVDRPLCVDRPLIISIGNELLPICQLAVISANLESLKIRTCRHSAPRPLYTL